MKNFIPVNEPLFVGNEIKYLTDCIQTGWVSSDGKFVKKFESKFAKKVNRKYSSAVSSGSAALELALSSLDIKKNDEIILPNFTIVSCLLPILRAGAKPILIDCNFKDWNCSAEEIIKRITSKTKVIVPVHLYGQSSDMEGIMDLAKEFSLHVIEDNAQAIGAKYTFSDGTVKSTGTIGHIGTTSFFPSKNLGCYGDGGAMFTNDDKIAKNLKMLANHGQEVKYYHKVTGCNSRLDSIQAAILNIKLNHLDSYSFSRNKMAKNYDENFLEIPELSVPKRQYNSTHVFHQYTLKIVPELRKSLIDFLKENKIPVMIYYPVPLYKQEAFSNYVNSDFRIENVEQLCNTVFSLPIHTEIENSSQDFIIQKVKEFFNKI